MEKLPYYEFTQLGRWTWRWRRHDGAVVTTGEAFTFKGALRASRRYAKAMNRLEAYEAETVTITHEELT